MRALAKSKIINIECVLSDPNLLPENSIGERILRSRKIRDLTIKELSELSCLSKETISNIEKSITTPNISSIVNLCQALDTSINYILNTDKLPEKTSKEIIYKYRLISGLSITELAKKCNLHKSTLKDYENGKLSRPETIQLIYKAVGYKK